LIRGDNADQVFALRKQFYSQIEKKRRDRESSIDYRAPVSLRDCDHRFFPLFQTSRSHAKTSDSVASSPVEGSGFSAKAILGLSGTHPKHRGNLAGWPNNFNYLPTETTSAAMSELKAMPMRKNATAQST
jgi:hypothetical protein